VYGSFSVIAESYHEHPAVLYILVHSTKCFFRTIEVNLIVVSRSLIILYFSNVKYSSERIYMRSMRPSVQN